VLGDDDGESKAQLGDDDGDFGRFPLRGLPAPGLLFFGGRPTGLFLRFTAFLLFAMPSTSADNSTIRFEPVQTYRPLDFTIRFEPVQTVRFGQRILKNSTCHFKSAIFCVFSNNVYHV
jgi:hypothetical protein